MNTTQPWRSAVGDIQPTIQREDKKLERTLDRIDEKDKQKIQNWHGQESADRQYEGILGF